MDQVRNEFISEYVGAIYQLQSGCQRSSYYNAGTYDAWDRRDCQREFGSGSYQIGDGVETLKNMECGGRSKAGPRDGERDVKK